MNLLVKPFQSMGLLGERDICRKVLELPTPLFNRSDNTPQRPVEPGKEAETLVRKAVSTGMITGTLATRRRLAREAAAAQLREIDEIVRVPLKGTTWVPRPTGRILI